MKDDDVLTFLRERTQRVEVGPTLDVVAENFGRQKSSVWVRMRRLAAQGLVKYTPRCGFVAVDDGSRAQAPSSGCADRGTLQVDRERILALWADWVHNGWDRPDDALKQLLGFTDEEQTSALEWSEAERDRCMFPNSERGAV